MTAGRVQKSKAAVGSPRYWTCHLCKLDKTWYPWRPPQPRRSTGSVSGPAAAAWLPTNWDSIKRVAIRPLRAVAYRGIPLITDVHRRAICDLALVVVRSTFSFILSHTLSE